MTGQQGHHVNAKRFDFAPEKFPITIEALHPDTGAVVWTVTVEEPDGLALVRIPPLAQILGHAVNITIRFGDGEVSRRGATPPSSSSSTPA